MYPIVRCEHSLHITEVLKTTSYNARVFYFDKQYQSTSGMQGRGPTDFQWCKEHGIRPHL